MNKNSKIYIAGHTGMVGSAILRNLKNKGYKNIIFRDFAELDLTKQQDVIDFFEKEKPEYVFLAAAKVGGIVANNNYRAEFIYDNLQIQNNIIHQSYKFGVKKLLFLGSSCIYPKNAPQPLKEEYLLTSELEYTNEPYAIAKISGIKVCESYNIQYKTNFIPVMPTNLYGKNDNYDLEKSHVLPALIRKMHLGKCLENNDWQALRIDLNKNPIGKISGKNSKFEIVNILKKYGIKYSENQEKSKTEITLWGTGNPYREFLNVNDMADACVYVMENLNFDDIKGSKKQIKNTHINIGCGEDITIKKLAETVKNITKYQGKIIWDSSKPDGTFRKLLDVSKLKSFGWTYKISLTKGISETYKNYITK